MAMVTPRRRSFRLKISLGSFFHSGDAHSEVPPPMTAKVTVGIREKLCVDKKAWAYVDMISVNRNEIVSNDALVSNAEAEQSYIPMSANPSQ